MTEHAPGCQWHKVRHPQACDCDASAMTEAHNGLFISGKPLGEWKMEYDDFQGALHEILNEVESLGQGYGPVEWRIVDQIGRIARSALTGGQ